jgi:hypothetical protein
MEPTIATRGRFWPSLSGARLILRNVRYSGRITHEIDPALSKGDPASFVRWQCRQGAGSVASVVGASAQQDRRPLRRARWAEEEAAEPGTASPTMVRWFDDERVPSPFLKALEKVRGRLALSAGDHRRHR